MTPANVYLGPAANILAERDRIKRTTMADRRLQHNLGAENPFLNRPIVTFDLTTDTDCLHRAVVCRRGDKGVCLRG